MKRHIIRIHSTNNVPPRQVVKGSPYRSRNNAWLRMVEVATYKHDSLTESGYDGVRLTFSSPESMLVTYTDAEGVEQRIEYKVDAVKMDMPCPTCRTVAGNDECHLCYGMGFVAWGDLPESYRS